MINTFTRCTSLLLAAGVVLAACSGEDAPAAPAPVQIRALHPTFTNTPQPVNAGAENNAGVENAAANNAAAATPSPTQPVAPTSNDVVTSTQTTAAQDNAAQGNAAQNNAAQNTTGQGNTAILVINAPQVNARQGPGTNFPIVQIVTRGQQFEIKGRNAAGDWWQVCCINNQVAWVIKDFADTDGDIDSVPVVTSVAAPVANTPAPVAVQAPTQPPQPAPPAPQPTAPPAPAPTAAPAAPAFEFDLLLKEQFPENQITRVFLYVFDKAGVPLEGYSVNVTRNGATVAVNASNSFGGQPGLTWPFAGDPRQRLQNFKAEFPGEGVGGTWLVQLSRGGQPVGPPATFQLSEGDTNRELYVRYQKK